MMQMESVNIVLFDDQAWNNLLPLTFTKPVAELRVGITTIFEKWMNHLDVFNEEISYLTQLHLSDQFVLKLEEVNLFINGSVLPNENLIQQISALKNGDILFDEKQKVVIAFKSDITDRKALFEIINGDPTEKAILLDKENEYLRISELWHIFEYNAQAIVYDFESLEQVAINFDFFNNNMIIGNEDDISVLSEEDISHVCFNTENGPIYIGQGVKIMEGSYIRGPFAICDHSVVKMAAKIYGGTTIGPHSKVGGELNNVVIQSYSNKGHDGFLGNAVIGSWCNLGADSNCSNLKNNYADVKMWRYPNMDYVSTERQFCGLIMGDHSKCGINTMFNTGTVVGVSANVFGAGFPPKFIPSFAWGGPEGFQTYKFDKVIETAQRVMLRRNHDLSKIEKNILKFIFEMTEKNRFWEKTVV